MPKNHWHKRFHSAALSGYVGLTLEERGAYSTFLDLLYDTEWDEGLADRDRWFAGHLDISPRKWRSVLDSLVAKGKIDRLPNGFLSNKKYRIERENALNLSRKLAENGLSGARARHEQHEKSNDIKQPELALAKPLPPYTRAIESEIDRDNNNDDDSLEGRDAREIPNVVPPAALVDRLARLAGIPIDLSRLAYAREVGIVTKWIAEGIDVDKIVIPTIGAIVAKTDAETIGTFRYFDNAIRTAHAKASAAPPPKPVKPRAPMPIHDDDDPRIVQFRERMSRHAPALTPEVVALRLAEPFVDLVARTTIEATGYLDENRPALNGIATALGFEGVRTAAM